jgi:NAD(P)-dependent dehydrogenase (short-subunit alcohol dehydrogenase family)
VSPRRPPVRAAAGKAAPSPVSRQRTSAPRGILRGQVAVVTGASRGIGLALAQALAAAGADLALCARNTKFIPNAELADAHNVRILVAECDVRQESSVARFFAAVKKRFGKIHILVNNAGVFGPASVVERMETANWQDVISTNLNGIFFCTRAALPLMGQGAAIVNNLSVAAKAAFPEESAYVASKHGARGFTDALREELRGRGIRVIGLYPGPTDTDLWNQFRPQASRKNMMSPDTVAAAVLHALVLPEHAAVEDLTIAPTRGLL